MTSRLLVAAAVPIVPLVAAGAAATLRGSRALRSLAFAGGALTAVLAGVTAGWALLDPGHPLRGRFVVVDVAGGVLVGVIALVGALSLLVSPTYLASSGRSLFPAHRAAPNYYTALLIFWSALLAVPLAANVGAAWLLIEGTTAASALLVAFSGKPRALEAAWKYLVLTSLGLGAAFLGIIVLQAAQHRAGGTVGLSYTSIQAASPGLDHHVAVVAYLLLLGGLAAKIGWAPVHNWLPDAHSEAPPPISAMLSAALLPAVLLVAWRVQHALAAAVGAGTSRNVFLVFGLASLAVAVPFLWRPLAWKRLLAYSSLEHMGVIALGIGFGSQLALIGAIVHVAGHAIAKALGFYAAIPLLAVQPSTASHPARGVGRTDPRMGAVLGLCLGTLAGLPPSPLFVSELLIALGGIESGHTAVVVVAVALLALGFLGLAHALIDAVSGRRHALRPGVPVGRGLVVALAAGAVVALLAVTVAGLELPGSSIADALSRGLA
ncbi:MAG: hydrogenase-4 component [Gaiellales bacterium]|nr:hydrogenase-4 component [Gaiellales bacterium]